MTEILGITDAQREIKELTDYAERYSKDASFALGPEREVFQRAANEALWKMRERSYQLFAGRIYVHVDSEQALYYVRIRQRSEDHIAYDLPGCGPFDKVGADRYIKALSQRGYTRSVEEIP